MTEPGLTPPDAAEDVTREMHGWDATVTAYGVRINAGPVSIVLPRAEAAKLAHAILLAYGGSGGDGRA